jgi:hypothetical protein
MIASGSCSDAVQAVLAVSGRIVPMLFGVTFRRRMNQGPLAASGDERDDFFHQRIAGKFAGDGAYSFGADT